MTAGAAPITFATNVDEMLDRFPATARVLVQRRMHCVGCSMARFETVADVCAIYRVPLDALLVDLNSAVAGRNPARQGMES